MIQKPLFSVKNAYKVAYALDDQLSSSIEGPSHSPWNFIWKAMVPNKVKLCVWWISRAVLPTCSCLDKKGIAVYDICVLCSSSPELALHVFTECHFARAVCSSTNIGLGPRSANFSSFLEWVGIVLLLFLKGNLIFLLLLFTLSSEQGIAFYGTTNKRTPW